MSARIKTLKEKCTHAVNNLNIVEKQADEFLEALDCDISEFRDNYLSGMQKLDELIYIVTDFNISIEKAVVDVSQYAPVQDLMKKGARQSCEQQHLLDVLSDPLPGNSCMRPSNTEAKPPKPKLPKGNMLISLSSDSDLDEGFENNSKEILLPAVVSVQPESSMTQLEASMTLLNTTQTQPTSDQYEASLNDRNTLLAQPEAPVSQLDANLDNPEVTLPQPDLKESEEEEKSNDRNVFEEYDDRRKSRAETDLGEVATLTNNLPLGKVKAEEAFLYDALTPLVESSKDSLDKEPPDMALAHPDDCTNDVNVTRNRNHSLNIDAHRNNNVTPNIKDSARLHTSEDFTCQDNVSGSGIELDFKTDHCEIDRVSTSINEKSTLGNTFSKVVDPNEIINNKEISMSPKILTTDKDKDHDNTNSDQVNVTNQNRRRTIDNIAVTEDRQELNEISGCYKNVINEGNQSLSNNVYIKHENLNQDFESNKDSIDKEHAVPESTVNSIIDESKINLQKHHSEPTHTKMPEKVQLLNQLTLSSEVKQAENKSTPVSSVENKHSLNPPMRAIKGAKPRSQEMLTQSNLQRFGPMLSTHNIPNTPNLPPRSNTYSPYVQHMQVPSYAQHGPEVPFYGQYGPEVPFYGQFGPNMSPYGYNMQPLVSNMPYFDPNMPHLGHGMPQFANMPPSGPVMQHGHPTMAPYGQGPYVPGPYPSNPMYHTGPHNNMLSNPTNTGRVPPWNTQPFEQNIRPSQPYKINNQVPNFQGTSNISRQSTPRAPINFLDHLQVSNKPNKSVHNGESTTTTSNIVIQPEEIKSIKEEKTNNENTNEAESLILSDNVDQNMKLNASSPKVNNSGKEKHMYPLGQPVDIGKTEEKIPETAEGLNLLFPPTPTTPTSRHKDDDGIPLPAQTVLECDHRYVCLLTHVGDPTSFYIITDVADRLNEMHAEMWEYYSARAGTEAMTRAQLQRVTYAACLDHEHSMWLRCLIIDAESKGKVSVFAVDLGLEASCDVADMQPLPPAFRVYPPSARCCHLAGIDIPPEHFEAARDVIKQYEGQALYMEVEDNSWESLEVRLTPLAGGEELGSVLVRSGLAASQGQLAPAPAHYQPAPAHDQLEPPQCQLESAHDQLEPASAPTKKVTKYTPPHLRPKSKSHAKLSPKATSSKSVAQESRDADRPREGGRAGVSCSELAGARTRVDGTPDEDDDEDVEEEYDDPLMAVQGYRNRDEADVCRHYKGPPAAGCFKGARCKKRHVLLHPDGWTMDRVSVVARGREAALPAPGAALSVRVVHVANYNVVYAHILDKDKAPGSGSSGGGGGGGGVIPRTLGQLVRAMNSEVAVGALRPLRQLPAVGELLTALYPPDRRYYRATVLEIDCANDALEVMYVDYGNRTWLKLNQLRILDDPTFLMLPFQAVRCVLAGVVVRAVEAWGRARDQLHALVYEKTLHATVVACGHDELTLELVDADGFRVAEQLAAMKVVALEPFEVQRVDPAAGPVLVPA